MALWKYRFFCFLTMTPTQLSINLMTNEQGVRSTPLAFRNDMNEQAYASPRTDAPALIAKKGTAPQRRAAHGAEPGFDSEWAMYRYPAVAVNKPIAVELSVRRSLINVSFCQLLMEDVGQELTVEKMSTFPSPGQAHCSPGTRPECIARDTDVNECVAIQLIQ
jgi:hypothetical protein